MRKVSKILIETGGVAHAVSAKRATRRYVITTAAALTLYALGGPSPAWSLPDVNRGDLNQHCISKYLPRGIQATADPYYAPLAGQLRCRLPGSVYGHTIENQSAQEVCQTLTGSGAWQNLGGRVRCSGGASSVTLPSSLPNVRRCNWVWSGGAFVCR